jgi:hypothetical protein
MFGFDDEVVVDEVEAGPYVFDALAGDVETVGLLSTRVVVGEDAALLYHHKTLLPLPQVL